MKKLVSVFFFFWFSCIVNAQNEYKGPVKYVDIINWSHTDYGFTDHPLIVAELQKRYIDIAIDLAEKTKNNKEGERFTWTVESLGPLYDWWQETTSDRQKMLLEAIANKQIDVSALPFNIHPALNDVETDVLTNWIPVDLWNKLKPRLSIQNDVNGFSRAVAERMIDKNVRYVWLGMNGRHPFPVPTLSWWQMPDGKKLLLWNGTSYWAAYDFFHTERWRTNAREATNLLYRWPRDNEFFKSDPVNVLKAHTVCCKKLMELQSKGFNMSILPITFSNQFRCDNDGPFGGVVEFVKKWNELGLKPVLRLSTATESMQRLENSCTKDIRTLTGEFGDWWAFGLTALPRELSVARSARYMLQAAMSPVLGPVTKKCEKDMNDINRDLCTFYEHTFAAGTASSEMYKPFNQGNINEVNRYAYKAYEFAKWQLAKRVRSKYVDDDYGLYVVNTQKTPFSGWINFEFVTLRDKKVTGLLDTDTGDKIKLNREGGVARFWVEDMKGISKKRFIPCYDADFSEKSSEQPRITLDKNDWPVKIVWPGMKEALYEGNIGDFSAYFIKEGGWWGGNAQTELFESNPDGKTEIEKNGNTTVYTQKLVNDWLVSLKRILEVHHKEARINLKVVYDRMLHTFRVPEFFYIKFPIPDKKCTVVTSNGGSVFTPYIDNIPNTCKTFYVVDSWVAYQMDDGFRVWASKTSPVVSFGDSTEFYKKEDAKQPKDMQNLRSMVYNNAWGVNFPTEYSGEVVCEYDLFWSPQMSSIHEFKDLTDSYIIEPVVTFIPKMKENELYNKWINEF